MKLKFLFTVVMLAIIFQVSGFAYNLPIVAAQDPYACDGDGIYLYEDSNYAGRCVKLTSDMPDLSVLSFDNEVSSVRMIGSFAPWRYQALLCRDTNYEGVCTPIFIGDDPALRDNRIGNDRLSSVKIKRTERGEAIRIATKNVQALPNNIFIEGWADGCCEDIPNRPDLFVQQIIDSNYDFIVLNEAFDEDDMREPILSKLHEYYPFYVAKLATQGSQEDSGLMLLSRFPFEPLPRNTYGICVFPENGECDGKAHNGDFGNWEEVAFLRYDVCSSYDCLANKGVGFVRIRNPLSGRIYNVVFTHLNAGDPVIRRRQLSFIEQLIRGTLTEEQIVSEDLFLMGDLNIKGPPKANDAEEWAMHFESSSSFFRSILQDVWHFQINSLPSELSSFADQGLTSNAPDKLSERNRIDYILHNNPDVPNFNNELCVQYMAPAYNLLAKPYFADGVFGRIGGQYISDHYGVNADINLRAPHCSPEIAYANPPLDQFLNGRITYPGSMQWYRLDPASLSFETAGKKWSNGTYSFQVRSTGPIEFQVFSSDNFAAPLSRQNQDQALGWMYHSTSAPLYIRVFSLDRN